MVIVASPIRRYGRSRHDIHRDHVLSAMSRYWQLLKVTVGNAWAVAAD